MWSVSSSPQVVSEVSPLKAQSSHPFFLGSVILTFRAFLTSYFIWGGALPSRLAPGGFMCEAGGGGENMMASQESRGL